MASRIPPAPEPASRRRGLPTRQPKNTQLNQLFAATMLAASALITPALAQTEARTTPVLFHHDIFITLKDASPAAVDRQLELGRKYLTDHRGEVFFSSTVLAEGLTRHQQVSYLHNETDFSVAFHLVFKDGKAHDQYQNSDRHAKHFIPMSSPKWKEIRVFDTKDQ